jgi:DNA-binding MarR family transcriptional regulator
MVARRYDLLNAFAQAHRALGGEMEEALQDRGSELSPSFVSALLLIDRSGTRLTEVARRAGVSKQAMMQLLDSLESLGCVRRVPDQRDGRAKIVKPTAKGLRQRAEAQRALAAVEARTKRRLGDRRYEALKAALQELSRRAE